MNGKFVAIGSYSVSRFFKLFVREKLRVFVSELCAESIDDDLDENDLESSRELFDLRDSLDLVFSKLRLPLLELWFNFELDGDKDEVEERNDRALPVESSESELEKDRVLGLEFFFLDAESRLDRLELRRVLEKIEFLRLAIF